MQFRRSRNDATGRASKQSKVLWRSISMRLVINWLIYSVVFVSVAIVFNITAVPKIANDIADSTSEWITCEFSDYPIDEVLGYLQLDLIGYGSELDDSDNSDKTALSVSESEPELTVVEDGLSVAATTDSMNVDDDVYTLVSPIEIREEQSSSDGSVTVIRRYANANNIALDGTDLSKVRLLVSSSQSDVPYFTTLRSMQLDAILETFHLDGELDDGWQVIVGDDSIALRDLSVYNAIRALKWPLAICVYLIGCVLIVIAGYGRAMGYFSQLESAVAGLLLNRDKPIELPKALAITENELNSIRLSALSDERAAKAAEQRKDELVAYLAHDIKTPLTSVIGYLDLLDEAQEMPEDIRRRYIHTASEKAQRLEVLIDEFFEITRYNLQSIPIERRNIDAVMLCRQIADEFYPETTAKGMNVSIEGDSDVTIFADGDKLARVLGNVMRNAVAYADEGSTVFIEITRENTPKSICIFKITDTGCEISPAHLESIFDKFYREDSARSSWSGGSGLGLAIAKEIVLAHGGTIEAASCNGKTSFTISIPV